MANTELAAQPRTILGKKVSQLRRKGLVPCNVYGRNQPSTAVQVPERELKHAVRVAGHTGLVAIAIDGEGTPRTAVVREIQRYAMTGELRHVAFQQVSLTEKMTVAVPVMLNGHAPVTDLDGIVVQALDRVDIECLPGDIPQHIEVDISGMTGFDSQIHMRDLSLPGNVTVLTDPDLLVASVMRQTAVEEEEAPEAEQAAAEAAAEEETAPAAEAAPSEG
ncbi:MAG TPA: 50S ribosomal protein L25 [Dehalococcoidia bacterium]|nr:50S ribosomal protein L25 [Dehalococcoidia bacterium]